MATERDDAVWLHAQQQVTLIELSEACGLPVASLEELVEYGALVPADPQARMFGAETLPALRDAARLCADLELELPALAIVLRFLDRIHHLEAEVRHLTALINK